MFLDSGNIISDETFYTQSEIMVEKVPEFSAESLCLRQGMGLEPSIGTQKVHDKSTIGTGGPGGL